jgi:hypothetical protein
MSTLPYHVWDAQFQMLRVAFACAALHKATLQANDRKNFTWLLAQVRPTFPGSVLLSQFDWV